MRFSVPQFIDYEPKIVGPLTFKQFVYVGLAGAACFVLYFSLPFTTFLIATIFIMGGAFFLAFVTIGGRSLPTILANFLKYSLAPKMYIWRKKEEVVGVIKSPSVAKAMEGKEEELPLKIAEKSQLKKLHTKIETKTR